MNEMRSGRVVAIAPIFGSAGDIWAGAAARVAIGLRDALAARRARRDLALLDDRMLVDIGLSRAEIAELPFRPERRPPQR